MQSVNFSTVKCNEPLTYSSLNDNIKSIAEKMGMSQECTKQASNDFVAAQTSAQFKAPFIKMRADASFTKANNDMFEAGCGNFLLNSSNMIENIQRLKCVINEAQNSTSVSVRAGNKLTIRTLPLTPEEQQAKAKLMQGFLPSELAKVPPEMVKDYLVILQTLLDSYDRSLTITNSTLSQKITSNVKTLGTFSNEQISEMESAYKKIASDVVKNNVEKMIGANAMDENTRDVVIKKTEENLLESSTNIKKTLNTLTINANFGNETVFEVADSIVITDFQFYQDTVVDMATSMIVSDAIKDAMKATLDITKESVVENVIKKEVAGVDNIIKEEGGVNTGVVEAQNLEDISPTAYIVLAVIVVVVVIVIGLVLWKVLGGGGGSAPSAPSAPTVAFGVRF